MDWLGTYNFNLKYIEYKYKRNIYFILIYVYGVKKIVFNKRIILLKLFEKNELKLKLKI